MLTSDHLKTRLSAIGTGRPFGLQPNLPKNLMDGGADELKEGG